VTDASTRIRLASPDDAEALLRHLVRDRAAFAASEPARSEKFYTREGQAERLERYLGEHADGRMWPGVVTTEGKVVGFVTVSDIRRGPFLVGSVGYWIGTTHQGLGHAQRALGLLLAVMRDDLGLHRAEASTSLDNVASQRVLFAQGFRHYGTSRSSFLGAEGWRDSLVWERVL